MCACQDSFRCARCKAADYRQWDIEAGKLDDGEQARQDLYDARQQRPEDAERA